MKRKLVSTVLLPLSATLMSACTGEDPAPPQPPVAPDYVMNADEMPLGKTYEQWSEAWWLWALSIPNATNPIQEGACDQKQSGDVFFLAGNAGGTSNRTCTIPQGKAIFFPLVNGVSRACPELVDAMYTCEMATSEQQIRDSISAPFNDLKITMTLEVDGDPITNLEDGRAASMTFQDPTANVADDVFGSMCAGPIRDNTCGVAVGSSRMSAGDGYWVMLKPLAAGKHDIRFTGEIVFSPDSKFNLDVSYAITVAP